MKHFFRNLYDVVATIFLRFDQHGCMTRAAALSFTTLLSLVPLMTLSLTIFRAFPTFEAFGQTIQNFIFDNFIATSAEVVQSHLEQFAQQVGQLSVPSLIFFLLTGVLVIFNIEQAFNSIWRVKNKRKGIPAFLMYWAVITLLPLIFAAVFALGHLLEFDYLSDTFEVSTAGQILFKVIIPYILTGATFSLFYYAVPNCKVRASSAILGGFIAAVLFHIAKYTFAWYISAFPTYALLYGTLATIPIFLVWLYVSWAIILFGAVISQVLAGDKHGAEHVY